MSTTKTLRVSLTQEQFDLMKSKSVALGYATLSSYVRDACLKDIYYVRLLKEIHEKICK